MHGPPGRTPFETQFLNMFKLIKKKHLMPNYFLPWRLFSVFLFVFIPLGRSTRKGNIFHFFCKTKKMLVTRHNVEIC